MLWNKTEMKIKYLLGWKNSNKKNDKIKNSKKKQWKNLMKKNEKNSKFNEKIFPIKFIGGLGKRASELFHLT